MSLHFPVNSCFLRQTWELGGDYESCLREDFLNSFISPFEVSRNFISPFKISRTWPSQMDHTVL